MQKLEIQCNVENILITSGSQQALDYIGKLFLSPKDTVLLEWPTYLGALGAFNSYQASYDRLDLDKNSRSIDSYKVKAKSSGGSVKFAYMSVDFANPTGITMSRTKRESAISIASELDILLVEDAAYQGLRYSGDHIPPILALELKRKRDINSARTIYCGSFSKTLSPGLRLGWVCASKDIISKLVLMKQVSDLHSSTINQMVVTDVISNEFDTHVDTLRKSYRNRRDYMLKCLEYHMSKNVNWSKPDGGMFIWLELPEIMDGKDLLSYSLSTHKVAFVPGEAFFPDRSKKNTIRLSFSNSSENIIKEGISRLGNLLNELTEKHIS